MLRLATSQSMFNAKRLHNEPRFTIGTCFENLGRFIRVHFLALRLRSLGIQVIIADFMRIQGGGNARVVSTRAATRLHSCLVILLRSPLNLVTRASLCGLAKDSIALCQAHQMRSHRIVA